MAEHMTCEHRSLVKLMKKNMERYMRARSHYEYLQKCYEIGIIPRSLNVVSLVKSDEIWATDAEETYDILIKTSKQLVEGQIKKWEKRCANLDFEGSRLKRKLIELGEGIYHSEMNRLKAHGLSVLNVLQSSKKRKISRDTQEMSTIKEIRTTKYGIRKRKARRFLSKHKQNIPVTSVESSDSLGSNMNNHMNNIHGKVKNLSSKQLTDDQDKVLSLGPKFCPIEKDIDRARFQKDLNAGFRRMKLRQHFEPEEDSRSEEEKRFYLNKSEWEPPRAGVNPALLTHNMVVQQKWDEWKQITRVADNMSVPMRTALKGLRDDPDIDIKLDDKSGTFVVADKVDYVSSALNDLRKQSNISQIDPETDKNEIIKQINSEIAQIVANMVASKEILESTAEFIKHKATTQKLARYYCNWKCHKFSPTQTEFAAAAVRGIIACCATADEHTCDFLDFILNPGMQKLRSYLKGTKDFLQWVERLKQQYPELPPLFGILTIDYTAMYPSMPDDLILPAVREYLDSRSNQEPTTQSTMELLEVTRKYNYFEFGDRVFKQEGGCSIGKKHAPDACCLAAGKLEEETIFPSSHFQNIVLDDLSSHDPKERQYKRFIDDMIAATQCTREESAQFVTWLNTLRPELGFTYEWSDKQITFLDVTMIVEDGRIETDRHIKPTNPQLFLHYTSNHPSSVFKSIIYGQAITVKMICSKQEYVRKHMELLHEKFLDRGYPVGLIEENLHRGEVIERADILRSKPVYPHQACPVQPSKQTFVPTFIITYNPHNPTLRKWLQEVHFILLADRKLAKIFPNPPSVSFRQGRNLKQILVSSSLKQLPYRDLSDIENGCYRHPHGIRGRRCQLCPRLKEGVSFKSNYTGLTYKMRHRFTCKSKYCVYLITCEKCGKQYTGKTTTAMHIRHNGHKNEIQNKSSELGAHFYTCGLQNLTLQVIDCVKEGEDMALIQLEGVWQNRLATFQAHGNLNIRNEMR